MYNALSVLAGLLFLAAFVPYIQAIIKGQTKPAKTSWLIWATLDTIILFSLVSKHALNGQILGAVAGAWIVTYLAFRFGRAGWQKLDVFCLAGSVLGLILWAVTRQPVVALSISVVILLIGAVPTIVNAWRNPSRENKLAWTLYWLSCVCAILAIKEWTFVNAAQQVAFTIIDTIMITILIFKK